MAKISEKMISFRPDAGLMYLIQQVTKQTTDEILGFFYDFGKQIAIEGIAKMEGRSIRKDIQAMYPNTAIPFKILVKGHRGYGQGASASVEVTFPDNPTYMDTEKLMEMIMEKQLLGGSSLPDFEPPKSRTPKMYKTLIEEVLKNGQTIQHSGHSRETGSSTEIVDGSSDQPQSGSDEG